MDEVRLGTEFEFRDVAAIMEMIADRRARACTAIGTRPQPRC